MIPLRKTPAVSPSSVIQLLSKNYFGVMSAFYEAQSSFLTKAYKRYGDLENANIHFCFARDMHLQIVRQRERNLNFDLSLNNFWKNYNYIEHPDKKIRDIVNETGIPKETVRRKIKNISTVKRQKNGKSYAMDFYPEKKIEAYQKIFEDDINDLSIFISEFSKQFGFLETFSRKTISDEFKLQFSFYRYHFLSIEIQWLKMWQNKLKDNDLLLIIIQTIIPTLQNANKKVKRLDVENLFKIIGKVDQNCPSSSGIAASSIADVIGMPRATCIRKLEKLVTLGFLIREKKTKRYIISQNIDDRTHNILTKENVGHTIEIFSEFISIILNSLAYNRRISTTKN